VTPHVLIVGRLSPEAANVRGPAFGVGQAYVHAIARAGGIPLVLAPVPALLDRLPALLERVDAVVLHGGGDVDPARYGATASTEQLYGIVPDHDEVELAVVRAALRRDLPMLAICRGMQVLDVALGGTLVQHLGTEEHWFRTHEVDVVAGSRLAKALGAERAAACHSVHHQAVERLGEGLVVVGTAGDGVTEAVEVDGARWAVGVQWHPEDTAGEDAQQQSLFDELVRQAETAPG